MRWIRTPDRQRRVWAAWWMGFGTVGLLILSTVHLDGISALAMDPGSPPPDPLERARQALRRARVEAAAMAGEQVRQAEARGRVLEGLAARRGIFRWGQSNQVLELAALETEIAARRALWHARRTATAIRDQAAVELENLTARLRTAERRLEPLRGDRPSQQTRTRAQVHLENARRALELGALDELPRRIARAGTEITRLESRLDGRFSRLHDPVLVRRWQAWADATLAATRSGGRAVVVDKLAARVYLIRGGTVVEEFAAELGRNPLDDKRHAGDSATPEGRYRVLEKRGPGLTRYYRALLLDYPNHEDREAYTRARARGEIPRGRGIGGLIELHGHGGRGYHWTEGCVALTNHDMDRVFATLEVGDPVTIVGQARLRSR
jgi:hypothetical protein